MKDIDILGILVRIELGKFHKVIAKETDVYDFHFKNGGIMRLIYRPKFLWIKEHFEIILFSDEDKRNAFSLSDPSFLGSCKFFKGDELFDYIEDKIFSPSVKVVLENKNNLFM